MSTAVTTESLAAYADLDEEHSIAMSWLAMKEDPQSQKYMLQVIENPANEFVRQIKDPLNLISVMGPARSGKSTLMNLLAGRKKTELFLTYNGSETFTKGIFVPTKVFSLPQFSSLEGDVEVQSDNKDIKVSFLDTEGQGVVDTAYDLNLFSPALISSRVVIYNRTGGLQIENILTDLGMMVQAAQRLQTGSAGAASQDDVHGTKDANAANGVNGSDGIKSPDDKAVNRPKFGHLFIVFNQFRLNATDTAESLRGKIMTDETAKTTAAQKHNDIRKLLRAVFESIQVFILPDKLKQEARAAISDETKKKFLLLEDFEPKYLDFFKILRAGLSKALATPRELSPGSPLTGGSIADFMPSLADAINKADALNVGSIFEASQNDAINKAIADFRSRLSTTTDGFLEAVKPASLLSRQFDAELNIQLKDLTTRLSYMPKARLDQIRTDAASEAEASKKTLLDTNSLHVKSEMATELNRAIDGLENAFKEQFPESPSLAIAKTEFESRISAVRSTVLEAYKTKVTSYGNDAFPDDYEKTFDAALKVQRSLVQSRVDEAWRKWAVQLKSEVLATVKTGFEALAKETAVGDDKAYTSKETTIASDATSSFNKKIDLEYGGQESEQLKSTFAEALQSDVTVCRGLWQKNSKEVEDELQKLVETLKDRYVVSLRNALDPTVEPPNLNDIANYNSYLKELLNFCQGHKLNDDMTAHQKLQLDKGCSNAKKDFQAEWTQAVKNFQDMLTKKFDQELPLLLKDFDAAQDAIDVNISSTSITKANITSQCDSNVTSAKSKFDQLVSGMRVRENGPASPTIINSRRSTFEGQLKAGRNKKLSQYDELVSIWNRGALTTVVVPIIDTALDNKYASRSALDAAMNDARKTFLETKKVGDGQDAQQKWDEFMAKSFPQLAENVERSNAFEVQGLGADAATREIQVQVIKNIYRSCAGMVNSLNMCYCSDSRFNPDQIEELPSEKATDSKKADTQRKFIMRNDNREGYDWGHSTNLVFHDWTVEVSDIIFGKPVITEMKPESIYSYTYPPTEKPTTLNLGNSGTQSTTISNSYSHGGKIGLEVGGEYGLKDVWKVNMKATFGLEWTWTSGDVSNSSFTASTQFSTELPANKTHVVNQMIFNQRTTLSYTAKVRVVPKFKTDNGYTVWGGGGSYRDNKDTGALKDKYRKGDRTYQDFEFRRCDQIKIDADANADPWEWKLVRDADKSMDPDLDLLSDPKRYEFYVKGKWEGVSGKSTVTTITSKPVSLIPGL